MKAWRVKMARIAGTGLAVLLLAACASAPRATGPNPMFPDALFAPPSEPIGAGDLFALSPGMREYLDTEIAGQMRSKNRQNALVDALYSSAQLKLEYDSTVTRNAAEAFEARSGNCLSLVLMTSAFAKQLGLQVQYQSVYSEQSVSRSDGIVYLSNHINLTLRPTAPEGRMVTLANEPLTVDFIPASGQGRQRARVVREETIIAMYLNNKAAEAVRARRFDDAYWWARAAVEQDPGFLAAHNTLGVIYRRRGHLDQAELILRHAVAREPGNTVPMSNLARVLRDAGQVDEALKLEERVRRIEAVPAFHYFDIGMQAMAEKNYALARDNFEKEVERAASHHEFHAWLAAALFELGEIDQARKHLQVALENSSTPADRALYEARLDALRPRLRTLR
jgi:Flp pilus assembly protein TadD